MNQNIPQFLVEMLRNQYGEEITNQIMDGFCKKRPVSLRINTLKTTIDDVYQILDKLQIEYEKVSWSKEAIVIKNVDERKLQDLDIYKNGKIYLQSLSSMLPPIILKPKPNTDILDMAAAPGGKTTQLAALTQNKAHITACEMNKVRLDRLKYNVEKQGASCVYVMHQDARRIDDFFSFDNILLDSPCSGSGTLNANLENRFTMKLIEKSKNSQIDLLRKAVKILKPGREMVYSTCSILQCENEDVVNRILKEENMEVVSIEFNGIEDIPQLPTKIEGTLCVCPTEFYEGFFVAKLRKM